MTPRNRSLRLLPFLFLLGGPAFADKIYQTDGTLLEDLDIESESLTEVAYKKAGRKETVASEDVLRVVYERFPKQVDQAMGYLDDGDRGQALLELEFYVEEQLAKKSEKRFPWAPAFAAWKIVELKQQSSDLKGAEAAARQLITNYDDSRYLPQAYLAQAGAELAMDEGSKAEKTLAEFADVISSKGLSKRWELACRLAQVRAGTKSGDEKRADLDRIALEAGSEFPTVKSRARVAAGETYLEEAAATADVAKAKGLRGEAKTAFEAIVKAAKGDPATLAGAHTGLGDCLFYLGADADDAELLREACMNYLRVITLYEDQTDYVPRALFYAMRSFELMQEGRRKGDMKRELLALYPSSAYAVEAKKNH